MENGASSNEGKDPSSFLSQIIGNSVTVKLNSGVVYRGKNNKNNTTTAPSKHLPCSALRTFH